MVYESAGVGASQASAENDVDVDVDAKANINASKRRRISRACDLCRDKKIKCDGQTPCSTCISLKKKCSYNYVRKRKLRKQNRAETSLFARASNNSDEGGKGKAKETGADNLNSDVNVNRDIAEHSCTSLEARLKNLETMVEGIYEILDKHLVKKNEEKLESLCMDTDTLSIKAREGERVGDFASVTNLNSALSKSVLKLIESKLSGESILKVIDSLYQRMNEEENKLNALVDPTRQEGFRPLPPRQISQFLLNTVFSTPLTCSTIIDRENIQRLADIYYQNGYKELCCSDLVLLDITILLGALIILGDYDKAVKNCNGRKEVENIVVNEALNIKLSNLLIYREEYLENALFYFQQLFTAYEGMNTIYSLAILCAVSITRLSVNTSYMLVSTVVRVAQHAGLHRKESYIGLSEAELKRRLHVWWYCYSFDINCCIRTGNPPVIQDNDISSHGPDYLMWLFMKPFFKKHPEFEFKSSKEKDKIDSLDVFIYALHDKFGFTNAVDYYRFKFAKIQSKTHRKLFAENSLAGQTSDSVFNIVLELNKELDDWVKSMPQEFRPNRTINLDIFESNRVARSKLMAIHFLYYLYVMVINRVSLLAKNSRRKAAVLHSINLHLTASRRILNLSSMIVEDHDKIFQSVFLPISGFGVLLRHCIQHPSKSENPGIVDDINLLITSSMNLFQKTRALENCEFLRTSRFEILGMISRCFIKIAIFVYDNNNEDKFVLNEESTKYLQPVHEMIDSLKTSEDQSANEKKCLNHPSSSYSMYSSQDQNSAHYNSEPSNSSFTNIKENTNILENGFTDLLGNNNLDNLNNNQSPGTNAQPQRCFADSNLLDPLLSFNMGMYSDFLLDAQNASVLNFDDTNIAHNMNDYLFCGGSVPLQADQQQAQEESNEGQSTVNGLGFPKLYRSDTNKD
ncbi:hypothetical protein PACTADRAFT_48831 [Pachysolen tannophilus NRRL Y-2460]|uniref:Zn(2)-C6 fungal-type domain-containing protein n=1 Tax=Pachysolen tannophilus NRRL Y-2460 TaxID=669874 RepID=A0A1E4TZ98_PACTA|nr:hypothetical protein PACTADRAFT_48831 [Pachysolen tannophilus NRRL Y-2460]